MTRVDFYEESYIREFFGVSKTELRAMGGNSFPGYVSRMDIRDCWGADCYLCGLPVALGDATRDHIVPYAIGGPNIVSNFRPTHTRCNGTKGMELIPDMAIRREHQPRVLKVWSDALYGGWMYFRRMKHDGLRMPWIYRVAFLEEETY